MAETLRGRVGVWEVLQAAYGRLADVNAEETRRLLLAGRADKAWPGSSGQKGG